MVYVWLSRGDEEGAAGGQFSLLRAIPYAEVGGLLIRGYHGQVEDEILKYPLDHAPYRLMKWDDVEKRRWAKAE